MLEAHTRVADLVLDHPECAPILQRHRIDFCCRGHMPLSDAASERSVELSPLLTELESAIASRGGRHDNPASLSTPALVAHLIGTHHAYLRDALPFLRGLADKVARVHGGSDANLIALRDRVHRLHDALLVHLDQEEQTLFPLLLMRQDATAIGRELAAMETDHLEVGALLADIRTLARDFAPPEWACMSFRTLFAELHHLERDVLTHVHLENHALMPRFAAPTVTP